MSLLKYHIKLSKNTNWHIWEGPVLAQIEWKYLTDQLSVYKQHGNNVERTRPNRNSNAWSIKIPAIKT